MSTKSYLKNRKSKPVVIGNGPHDTLQEYDFEEHEQYITTEKDNNA